MYEAEHFSITEENLAYTSPDPLLYNVVGLSLAIFQVKPQSTSIKIW